MAKRFAQRPGMGAGGLQILDHHRLAVNCISESSSMSSEDASNVDGSGYFSPGNRHDQLGLPIYGAAPDNGYLFNSNMGAGLLMSKQTVARGCTPQWPDPLYSLQKQLSAGFKMDAADRSLGNSEHSWSSDPLGSADASGSAAAVRSHRGGWAMPLLHECAKAVTADTKPRMQQLLWMLNELSSPYGDYDQRLGSYFLQALFCKMNGTGPRFYRILCAAAERSYSFDSLRKMILKFQEASPWTTFGHVASNGAILEALEGEMKVHIVDISNTFCTQWPTLLESLATRAEGAPHLRLTTLLLSKEASAMKVMREIGARMEKFARLMGVPFVFVVLQQPELGNLEESDLNLKSDEALAINCNHSLHRVPEKSPGGSPFIKSLRDEIVSTLRDMNPKIVTVTEEEAGLLSSDFSICFTETLRFYSMFFESLEESFPRASNERLMLERTAGRNMINLLAGEDTDEHNCKRLEKGVQWGSRFVNAGFVRSPLSDDVVDDVRALLKRHKEGWGIDVIPDTGLFLTWKNQHAVCISIWKPSGAN